LAVTGMEQRRIRAVQFPARHRIQRLQNTVNVRTERAVMARERELRATAEAEMRQRELDLKEEARQERSSAENKWYIPIRDLWLKEFAAESQVDAYKPYPASDAYKESKAHLAQIRADRVRAEQQLSQDVA